jgi:hypothetical protein
MGEDLRNRLGGVVMLAAGIALGWWGIWLPLRAAQAHAPVVSYQISIFVAVPVAIIGGLYFILCGARWPYRDVERQRLTPVGWVLIAAIAIGSAISFYWLKSSFDALGYQHG